MAERDAKRTSNESVMMPLLSVLSISSYKMIFFSTWSVLILLSVFPWQLTILVAVVTGFIKGKRKSRALLLSILSIVFGWAFVILYFAMKSRGKILNLAVDLSVILLGHSVAAPLFLLSPLLVASIVGLFGGLIGAYAREFFEMRLTTSK